MPIAGITGIQLIIGKGLRDSQNLITALVLIKGLLNGFKLFLGDGGVNAVSSTNGHGATVF
ncbi:hypothetical protein Nizo2776_2963 [Lactiplantibacillus plantarum]|nr:hypothetical protein Nizo2776_2963 [Lactiplantibacillus plantarum]